MREISVGQYTITDTFSFVEELRNLDLDTNKVFMASFDISSLFTNIPIDETIDIIINRLFSSSTQFSGFSHAQFRKLLYFAVKNCHFLFNGRLYEQVDGVAMGSPLGPSFANTFLCYHEKVWLDNCPRDFKPLIYRRYVDDCFVIFRCPDHVKPFLDYLNSQHNSIKFSSETEVNNTLPFLDVLIKRNNGFSTLVYCKPTFSGHFTNFDSFIPLSFKRGLVYTLLDRYFKICSSYHIFHSEVIKLKNFLTNNGYPTPFFDLCLGKFLDKVFSVSAKNYNVTKRHLLFYAIYGETLPSNPFAVNKTSLLFSSS